MNPAGADAHIETEAIVSESPLVEQWTTKFVQLLRRTLRSFLGHDIVFVGTLLACFVALATWGILQHAMWRDELQAWLVAVDSRSLGELFRNLRLETHPYLWHLLLYIPSRFTANPVAMQVLHVALAVTTVWIFLRFSPFRRVEKGLFVFGYFPFYEYCLISRDYVLVVLLVFLFCALYQSRPVRHIPLALVLFCLPSTHMYGLPLAAAFLVFLICDQALSNRRQIAAPLNRSQLAIVVSLAVLGFAPTIVKGFLIPTSKWAHALTANSLAQSIITIWQAYVPIPMSFPYWPGLSWSSNFLEDGVKAPAFVLCLLSIGLIITVATILWKSPRSLLFYGLLTGSLLVFQFVVYCGPLRCAGILFIVLIAAGWLSASGFEPEPHSSCWGSTDESMPSWRRTFIKDLLLIQLAAGLYAYTSEWVIPFSGSREAAAFIRREGLAQLPIVASKEVITQGLAAYLQRPVYYADSSRLGSHCSFQEVKPASSQEILESAYQLFVNSKTDVVVALSSQITYLSPSGAKAPPSEFSVYPGGVGPRARVKSLAKFTRVTTDEPYFIYLLGLEQ